MFIPMWDSSHSLKTSGLHQQALPYDIFRDFKATAPALSNSTTSQCVRQKLQHTFRNAISCSQPLFPRSMSLPTWPPEGMLCLLKAQRTSLWLCQNCLMSFSNPGVSSSAQAFLAVICSSWAMPHGSKCVMIIVHTMVTRGLEITLRGFYHICVHGVFVCVDEKDVWGASLYCNAKVFAFSGYHQLPSL